jgi:predicted nicotinamide N-methyase
MYLQNAFLLLLGVRLALSFSVERRRSTLLPWSGEGPILGWIQEERDKEAGTLDVTIGWEEEDIKDAVRIQLPFIRDEESLASTLWPAASVGAILCRSPAFCEYIRDKDVLELGSGLGLAGWTAALAARTCILTDNDEHVVGLLKDMAARTPSNVQAELVEWRDERENVAQVDAVIATDVAYYYFLLRPLMDTATSFMKKDNSLFLSIGQANREMQWELYHNLADGCYNQLTDKREPPWPGMTRMLLYKLKMETWQKDGEAPSTVDGTVPVAALVHQNPGCSLPPFTRNDYVATASDQEQISMSF